MAYAQSTPVVTLKRISGRRGWRITFTETEAGSSDEWSVAGLPQRFTIVSTKVEITAGTNQGTATTQTATGRATGWTNPSNDHVGKQSVAAVVMNDQENLRVQLLTDTLYGSSNCSDATADHTILTELWIVEGWL